jgi:hypothetical protein
MNVNGNRGFFLYSPLSKLVSDSVFNITKNTSVLHGIDLDFFAVDHHLSHAESILRRENEQSIEKEIEEVLSYKSLKFNIDILRTTQKKNLDTFVLIQKELSSLLSTNRSLNNEILHHTYKNLHPRLKRINIKNQRHLIVKELSMFLFNEIAFTFWAREYGNYHYQLIVGDKGEFFPLVVEKIYTLLRKDSNIVRLKYIRCKD